jgi:hypothetical protein
MKCHINAIRQLRDGSRGKLISGAVAVLVYCAFAVLAYRMINPLTSTALPRGGSGDPAQMVWFLEWTPFALLHGFSLFHTSYIDFPHSVNLADNTAVPVLGLLGAPITLIFGPVAAFNFLIRIALAASATAMFFVLRRYCRSDIACFLGGLLFGFGPYLMSQAQRDAHLDLTFEAMLPLLVLAVDEVLLRRRWRPVFAGGLLGLVAAVQYLIDAEILSDCLVIAALFTIVLVVVCRTHVREQLSHALKSLAVAAGVFVVLVGAWLYDLLFGAGHLRGPVMASPHLEQFNNNLLSPFVPTTRDILSTHGLNKISSTFAFHNITENGGYLGIPLVIAVIAVAIWRWREPIVKIASITAVVAFILSLGALLSVGTDNTRVRMPAMVFEHLPLLDSTVPARYAVIVLLFVTILFAVGLDRAIASIRERYDSRERQHRSFLLLGLGVVVALVPVIPSLPLAMSELPWSAASLSSLKREVPKGSALLTYPYPAPPYSEAMLWQAVSGMNYRLFGGYATVQGTSKWGQSRPLIDSPAVVQEYLVSEEAPRFDYYHRPKPSTVTTAALCSYVRNYDVGAVVIWRGYRHWHKVSRYVTRTLGAPTYPSGTFETWRLRPMSHRQRLLLASTATGTSCRSLVQHY